MFKRILWLWIVRGRHGFTGKQGIFWVPDKWPRLCFGKRAPANVSGFCSYVDSYSNSTKTFRLFSDKFEPVSCKRGTVGFTLDSVELIAGKRYNLGAVGDKKNCGSYFMVPGCAQDRIDMFTSDGNSNYVIIKKVDFQKSWSQAL